MVRITPNYKSIAKYLGVSEPGLEILCRAVANNGSANGKGFSVNRFGSARQRLVDQGLLLRLEVRALTWSVYPTYTITPNGREIVQKARKMGW